jgi:hypothetical protein
LAKPDWALREKHLNRPQLVGKPGEASTPPVSRPKEHFCRQCDKRASGAIPSGWFSLRRLIEPGSWGSHLPPNNRQQAMGLYCGLRCLELDLPRLMELDADFTRCGVGLKPLAPGASPPEMPKPAAKGGPR